MMAIVARLLGSGQLPSSEGDLYVAGAGITAYVRTIILSNTGSGENICQLYIKPSGGSARRIARLVLAANYSGEVTMPLVLGPGDALRGVATNASEVDYTICGAEES